LEAAEAGCPPADSAPGASVFGGLVADAIELPAAAAGEVLFVVAQGDAAQPQRTMPVNAQIAK